MKNLSKLVSTILLIGCVTLSFSQKSSQAGVGIVLEMKPVLQLDMTSPEQINFVFDEKDKYYRGITKKAATILKVTSTVKWDLYAVGRSTGKSPNGKTFWDQEESYGSTVNSVADIPLSMLEIKQSNPNTATEGSEARYADYSRDFATAFRPSASNNLYVAKNGTPTPPTKAGKYIAGQSGVGGDKNDYMQGGSYTSNDPNFYYSIDYRILPGYPAIFPNAFNEDASIAENIVANASSNSVLAGGAASSGNKSFAEPGEYRMYVQYVLLEDQ